MNDTFGKKFKRGALLPKTSNSSGFEFLWGGLLVVVFSLNLSPLHFLSSLKNRSKGRHLVLNPKLSSLLSDKFGVFHLSFSFFSQFWKHYLQILKIVWPEHLIVAFLCLFIYLRYHLPVKITAHHIVSPNSIVVPLSSECLSMKPVSDMLKMSWNLSWYHGTENLLQLKNYEKQAETWAV